MDALRSVVVGVALAVAGCAVGPDFKRPPPPQDVRFTPEPLPPATVSADGQAQRFIPGTVTDGWWRQLGAPQLDTVVAEALANNPGLAAAEASLRRSQAELRAGYGVFYPQLEAGFDAQRQKSLPQRLGQDQPGGLFNLFTLSASVSYAIDLFGGEKRAVEGLQAEADLQRYQLQAVTLTLSANVVNALIARAGYAAQIDISRRIVAMLQEQVDLAAVRAQAGTAPYTDMLSLRSQLAAFEAAVPPLQQKLAQADDLLATLVGRTPAQWQAPPLRLEDLHLPAKVPSGLPSQLVEQRPDILAGEAQLHAASAGIGVATAAMLPSLTLTGGYGTGSNTADQLFAGNGRFWNVGTGLTAPLAEGGTLWFRRRSAIEQYRQAEAGYRQTVLAAFAQVADVLRALQHDAETLEAQSRQLDAAEQALHLLQANYSAGVVSYVEVLTANAQYQQAAIACLQTRALRLQDTVALYAALGGGWGEVQASPQARVSPPVHNAD
jgi:NodT family efflux transporter outer membrane factor (OMF) lipoprotein